MHSVGPCSPEYVNIPRGHWRGHGGGGGVEFHSGVFPGDPAILDTTFPPGTSQPIRGFQMSKICVTSLQK